MPKKPNAIRTRSLRTTIIQAGSVAGALIAIGAAWHQFGGDTIAWSSDIRRLDARQTESAIDVYSKAVRDDTILRNQINDAVTRALIDQRLKESLDKLNAAQQRKIELGK